MGKERQRSNKSLDENEDEIFRSAALNAWVNSKMERDKSLLTLSSGGIGLLVTFLNFKDNYSCWEIILYICSFLAFIVCIGSVIYIFTKNPKYLERLLEDEQTGSDKWLGILDYTAVISFCFGIIFISLIGVLNLI